MMPKLSINAQKSFDDYLYQVRILLRGIKTVDSDEIVQNINEHIENELSTCPEPVSSEELEDVLTKLGSPEQWVPQEEISWWKKILLRLRSGPEDWRLAYLSFGLFIIGFLFPPAFLILLPASYLLSRAAMSLSNYNIKLKAQKWLLYPSVFVITVAFAFFLITVPAFILEVVAENLQDSLRETHNINKHSDYWILADSLIGMLTCLWCIFVGVICLIFPSLPKKLFFPMAQWFKRKHALIFIVLALIFFIISLAVWVYAVNTYI